MNFDGPSHRGDLSPGGVPARIGVGGAEANVQSSGMEWADGSTAWLGGVHNPRQRYLTLSDPGKARREGWLAVTFGRVEQHAYAANNTSYLSVAVTGFDGLIVGGNDLPRMIKIVRSGSAILARRMKLALLNGGSAQRRAQLIAAGFDDVFDTEKTHPQEAQARVGAIWRRYLMRFEHERIELNKEILLSRICNPHKLTDREKRLLLLLLTSEKNFALYRTIKRELSDYHEEISDEYLKVIVCLVRRKLMPGVRIVARAWQGYRLEF